MRLDELLERESELTLIDEALASARAAAGSLLVIEGHAGLGKTSLLKEARRRAGAAGVLVLSAAGAELEREYPFGIALQLLEPPVRRASIEQRRRLLAGSATLAAPLLDRTESTDGGEQSLLHGLFWLMQNLAERAPVLVAVDDAHWADPSSLRFLLYLAQRIEELPVALVVGARVGEPDASPGLARVAVHPLARRLTPAPLSEAAVGELVRRRERDADPAFVRACA